jgi:hypothetical protein
MADAVRTERAIYDKVWCGATPRRGMEPNPGTKNSAPSRHRGDAAPARHPLRRHQSRTWLGGVALRQPLLHAQPGRATLHAWEHKAPLKFRLLS